MRLDDHLREHCTDYFKKVVCIESVLAYGSREFPSLLDSLEELRIEAPMNDVRNNGYLYLVAIWLTGEGHSQLQKIAQVTLTLALMFIIITFIALTLIHIAV